MVKSKSLALEAPIQFSQQGVSLPQGRTKAEGLSDLLQAQAAQCSLSKPRLLTVTSLP